MLFLCTEDQLNDFGRNGLNSSYTSYSRELRRRITSNDPLHQGSSIVIVAYENTP